MRRANSMMTHQPLGGSRKSNAWIGPAQVGAQPKKKVEAEGMRRSTAHRQRKSPSRPTKRGNGSRSVMTKSNYGFNIYSDKDDPTAMKTDDKPVAETKSAEVILAEAKAAATAERAKQHIHALEQQLLRRTEENAKLKQTLRQIQVADAATGTPSKRKRTTGGASPATTQPPVASSTIFGVADGSNTVRRSRLARCCSMDTAKILAAQQKKQLQQGPDPDIESIAERVSAFVLTNAVPDSVGRDYGRSSQFASDIGRLSAAAGKIMRAESRLLELRSPIYIFGDIHGNIRDLRFFADNLWTFGLKLTAGSFLCLGDYVDRGAKSIEVAAYMLAQKVLSPRKLYLLRGNHETREVNGWVEHYKMGSFLAQTRKRFGKEYGQMLWEHVNRAFDCMPLAAIVDNSIFCVHGGIPRPVFRHSSHGGRVDLRLDAIRNLPSTMGIAPKMYAHETRERVRLGMDLIWADPATRAQEASLDAHGFGPSRRGGEISCYGKQAVAEFLELHSLSYVVRAHEATADGIGLSKGATVFTVFSTSKDHGCGPRATCGCLLVDDGKVLPIQRVIGDEDDEDDAESFGDQDGFWGHDEADDEAAEIGGDAGFRDYYPQGFEVQCGSSDDEEDERDDEDDDEDELYGIKRNSESGGRARMASQDLSGAGAGSVAEENIDEDEVTLDVRERASRMSIG